LAASTGPCFCHNLILNAHKTWDCEFSDRGGGAQGGVRATLTLIWERLLHRPVNIHYLGEQSEGHLISVAPTDNGGIKTFGVLVPRDICGNCLRRQLMKSDQDGVQPGSKFDALGRAEWLHAAGLASDVELAHARAAWDADEIPAHDSLLTGTTKRHWQRWRSDVLLPGLRRSRTELKMTKLTKRQWRAECRRARISVPAAHDSSWPECRTLSTQTLFKLLLNRAWAYLESKHADSARDYCKRAASLFRWKAKESKQHAGISLHAILYDWLANGVPNGSVLGGASTRRGSMDLIIEIIGDKVDSWSNNMASTVLLWLTSTPHSVREINYARAQGWFALSQSEWISTWKAASTIVRKTQTTFHPDGQLTLQPTFVIAACSYWQGLASKEHFGVDYADEEASRTGLRVEARAYSDADDSLSCRHYWADLAESLTMSHSAASLLGASDIESAFDFWQCRQNWSASGSAGGYKAKLDWGRLDHIAEQVAREWTTRVRTASHSHRGGWSTAARRPNMNRKGREDDIEYVHLNKRGALEQMLFEEIAKVTAEPGVMYSAAVEKHEDGKARLLLTSDVVNYVIMSYVLSPVEKVLSHDQRLDYSDDVVGEWAKFALRVRQARSGETLRLWDYVDFNAQHTNATMVVDMTMLGQAYGWATYNTPQSRADMQRFADWCANSFNNMWIKWPDLHRSHADSGLASGCRGTTWINTTLNAAYNWSVRRSIERLLYVRAVLYETDKGDDVWQLVRDWFTAALLSRMARICGYEGTPSKCFNGPGFGEYLKQLYGADGSVVGCSARSIPMQVVSSWQNRTYRDPIDTVLDSADLLGLQLRRGVYGTWANRVFRMWSEYWGQIKVDANRRHVGLGLYEDAEHIGPTHAGRTVYWKRIRTELWQHIAHLGGRRISEVLLDPCTAELWDRHLDRGLSPIETAVALGPATRVPANGLTSRPRLPGARKWVLDMMGKNMSTDYVRWACHISPSFARLSKAGKEAIATAAQNDNFSGTLPLRERSRQLRMRQVMDVAWVSNLESRFLSLSHRKRRTADEIMRLARWLPRDARREGGWAMGELKRLSSTAYVQYTAWKGRHALQPPECTIMLKNHQDGHRVYMLKSLLSRGSLTSRSLPEGFNLSTSFGLGSHTRLGRLDAYKAMITRPEYWDRGLPESGRYWGSRVRDTCYGIMRQSSAAAYANVAFYMDGTAALAWLLGDYRVSHGFTINLPDTHDALLRACVAFFVERSIVREKQMMLDTSAVQAKFDMYYDIVQNTFYEDRVVAHSASW